MATTDIGLTENFITNPGDITLQKLYRQLKLVTHSLMALTQAVGQSVPEGYWVHDLANAIFDNLSNCGSAEKLDDFTWESVMDRQDMFLDFLSRVEVPQTKHNYKGLVEGDVNE